MEAPNSSNNNNKWLSESGTDGPNNEKKTELVLDECAEPVNLIRTAFDPHIEAAHQTYFTL